MRERIMIRGTQLWKGKQFELLSADMRTVLSKHDTMEEAIRELERQVKLERQQCPTGSCED